MLHILALAYFVALSSVAAVAILATLLGNREMIERALRMESSVVPVVLRSAPRDRSPNRARVVRMQSAPALRLAA